jgi:hypothetical protein
VDPYVRGNSEAMDQKDYRSFISQDPIACFETADLNIPVFWHMGKHFIPSNELNGRFRPGNIVHFLPRVLT